LVEDVPEVKKDEVKKDEVKKCVVDFRREQVIF
jgi:hypothetical protein